MRSIKHGRVPEPGVYPVENERRRHRHRPALELRARTEGLCIDSCLRNQVFSLPKSLDSFECVIRQIDASRDTWTGGWGATTAPILPVRKYKAARRQRRPLRKSIHGETLPGLAACLLAPEGFLWRGPTPDSGDRPTSEDIECRWAAGRGEKTSPQTSLNATTPHRKKTRAARPQAAPRKEPREAARAPQPYTQATRMPTAAGRGETEGCSTRAGVAVGAWAPAQLPGGLRVPRPTSGPSETAPTPHAPKTQSTRHAAKT